MGFGVVNISVIVAVVSAFASLVAIVVSLRTARAQRDLARHLAEEEHLLLFEQVRMQRDSDVIRWTCDCVSVLSEMETFVECFDPRNPVSGQSERHQELCTRLSTLIDIGRLYFPNEAPESKGGDKPVAYQGSRQHIMSVLVFAYNKFKSITKWTDADGRPNALAKLNDYRRRFVSEAQIAIDPRRYIALKEMNELKRRRGVEEQDPSSDESFKKLI